MKRLIFAVLLISCCCYSTIGCSTAASMGFSAVKSGVQIYKAGSGSGTNIERYDAARHQYYTIDKDGNRQYK